MAEAEAVVIEPNACDESLAEQDGKEEAVGTSEQEPIVTQPEKGWKGEGLKSGLKGGSSCVECCSNCC